ncbi:MAG: hypothetical protein ABR927_06045 [Bacteroidales bacterium]|jgi:hypothetical protein
MKKGFVIVLFIVLCLPVLTAQNKLPKIYSAGTWKFDAPYAPEGYNSGIIVVGIVEQKPSAIMSFTGNDFKYPGENVKAEKDSILFSVYIQGQDVNVMLKIENDTLMSGKAVYSEGEVPLSLTKTTASEAEVKQ